MVNVAALNIRHLRALVEAVERGSISAAATAVGLSQPALTQGLAKLERQIGITLLDRLHDGVRARPEGTVLVARTRLAFDHLAKAMRGGRGTTRGFSRPDRLATSTQLRNFLSVADTGGYAAAAAATGQSLPAIHRSVRELEQICGVQLAERRGRGMQLTSAGRKVARGARLALAEIAIGILEVSGQEDDARLVVGAMPLCRALVLPHALSAYLQDSPRSAVEVVEGSWRELVDPLCDGQIDVMIGALRDDVPAGLTQKALFHDRLVVVGRAGHPLASHTAPTLEMLAGYPWVVGAVGTPLRAHWDALFVSGTGPPTPLECGSVMVTRGVLSSSDFLTLLSPDQVALEIEGGLLATIGSPLERAQRTIGITIRSDWRPTAAHSRFLDLLEVAVSRRQLQEVEYPRS